MSEYYAVQRSEEYLAHYGVKGMKWGVRKAIEKGGAAGERALGKQFAKAQKKLAKLEKRGASGTKYAKRAAKLGAAGAALGAAGALGSFENIKKVQDAAGNIVLSAARKSGVKGFGKGNPSTVSGKAGTAVRRGISSYKDWGSEKLSNATGNVTRHGAIRVGSMAAGAGLLGAAGVNAYKAATAGRNRKKAAQFRKEMQKTFAGTKYANQMPAQYQPKQKRRKSRNA